MNHVPKAVSDHDPLPDWVHDLNYVRCRLCTIASGLRADFAFLSSLPVHTNDSCSERALCSQVLRIRLSRRIMIQNAISSRFKSLIWKSFVFTKGKIRLSNQERVRIMIWNGFRNMICTFCEQAQISIKVEFPNLLFVEFSSCHHTASFIQTIVKILPKSQSFQYARLSEGIITKGTKLAMDKAKAGNVDMIPSRDLWPLPARRPLFSGSSE